MITTSQNVDIIDVGIIFFLGGGHQHKAAGLKIKLNRIKMVATASYSVTIVLWKMTAFPICRAIDKR